MDTIDATTIVHNALSGYVEDCAGAGSVEANTIQEAWDLLKTNLPETDRFPNGFTSWYETFFEIASYITNDISKWDGDPKDTNVVIEVHMNEGQGGVWELTKKWADEFELTNVGREWDGEFYDEIEEFVKSKNIK